MQRRLYFGMAAALVLSLSITWYFGTRNDQTRVVEPVADAQRVICMAPSIAEIVFALGQGDRVAGVSDFSDYPEEARQKPHCGGWMNPNFEVVTALRPDVIIIQGRHQKVKDYCDLHRIHLVQVDMNDLTTIFEGIRIIGEALGVPDRADQLCREITTTLDRVRAAVADLPKLKVFMLLGRAPGTLSGLYTVGPRSFLSEVLELAGGANLFSDAAIDYPQASKEALMARQPDVILEMHPGKQYDKAAIRALKADWQPLSAIPAVQHGRIYILTEDYALIPGPRMGSLAWRMAKVLHPELPHD